MTEPSSRRKLAAILSADVVGYSSLMAANEAATVETLKSYRDIISRLVVRRGGRVVNAPGDALLAEFPSAVEAVQAAIEVQKSLEGHNIELESERRMQFRIGVNLGDVIEEADGTIYGDGINIAARMEALAEGGGVCISSTVYDAVEGKLSFGFDFLGEQQVKNIPKPVRVYRVRAEPRPPSARPRSKRRMQWQITVPALALMLVLGAVGAWLLREHGGPTPQGAVEATATGMPKGPGVAVLPFVNLSGDANKEYFSDGLTEDILTELARVRDLRVLARNTTFQYKGKAADVSKLGRELGVRYVLEGSVRRAGDDLRVTAQLIDAETGAHIWADKFDRKMADVFLVQDEIVGQIVAKIASGYGVIQKTEAKSATRKSPEQVQAYDLVLRAHDVMSKWSQESFHAAREFLRQAIAIDPENARARREFAWLAVLGLISGVDETPMPLQEIVAQAAKAVQLDPADGRAHMVAAAAYFFSKQLESLFKHETEQAIALAPYDAEILATLAYLIATSGDWPRGVALATKANALNADAAAGWYHATLYLNYYLTGDYERALELIRQVPDQQTLVTYIDYLPILGQLGRKQEALEKWQKVLGEDPSWSAESFEKWYKLWNIRDEDSAKLMEGIYKTGVLGPEAKPGL
jgi:adenylate cyclase